jgi:cob(I)alamin adenosyltransferase
LVGGQPVLKNNARIEAFGEVDELNSVLGHIRLQIADQVPAHPLLKACDVSLNRIQNDLFRVGGDLATLPADRWEGMERLSPDDTLWIESLCDQYNEALPPLKEFILPGGGAVSCWFHTARTTARRAERRMVTLEALEPGSTDCALPYLNRLSDLFFILGRWASHTTGHATPAWERRI